jgi:hypothetical protein
MGIPICNDGHDGLAVPIALLSELKQITGALPFLNNSQTSGQQPVVLPYYNFKFVFVFIPYTI